MTEFMNGVEYLYTIPAEQPMSYWILLVVFFIWFVVFCVISLISSYPDNLEAIYMAVVMAAIATLISYFCVRNHNNDSLRPEQYAVTISDSVGMAEFAEKYNIVEQKENVYIIELKGNEYD